MPEAPGRPAARESASRPTRLVRFLQAGGAAGLGLVLLAGCGSAQAGPVDAGASGTAGTTTGSGAGSVAPTTATPSPTPTRYDGPVLAVGDSVMLGALTCLRDKRIKVDAEESRSFWTVAEILRDKAADARLADRVVIHTGTNGPFTADDFDALMSDLGDREVYWLTVHLPEVERYAYAADVNALLADRVAAWPNAHLIDWNAAALRKANADWLYGDDTHLTPDGCQGYADLVNESVRAPVAGR